MRVLVPLSMVIMGSIYYNSCPVQNTVPLWLVVEGSLYLVQQCIFNLPTYYNRIKLLCEENKRSCILTNFIIHSFLFIWLALGLIWILKANKIANVNDENSPQYCNKAVLLFAIYTSATGSIYCITSIIFTFWIAFNRDVVANRQIRKS